MSSVPSDIYARQLLPKQYGYPLFVPEPYDHLPETYRERGTRIGDVGIIKPNGSFSFVFNICAPADDPVNCYGVPDRFEQVHLTPGEISLLKNMHKRPSDVFSASVRRENLIVEGAVKENEVLNVPAGINITYGFTSASSEAAVLTLPEGAASEDVLNLTKFRRQALKNAVLWYEFVNGVLGREAPNGSLYLVTGCDKSTTWGVASVSCTSDTSSLSLKFTAAQLVEASAAYTYSWETYCPATVRTGPEPCGDSDLLRNQCVFLRGFKLMVNVGLAALRGRAKVSAIVGEKPGNIVLGGKGSYIPFMDGGNRSSSGQSSGKAGAGVGQQRAHSSASSFEVVDELEGFSSDEDPDVLLEFVPGTTEIYHPLNAINEYLLAAVPHAQVAVTHESDWWPLSKDDNTLPTDDELLDRFHNHYRPSFESGGVYAVPRDVEQLGDCVSPSVASSGDNQPPALLEQTQGSSRDSMTSTPPNPITRESKHALQAEEQVSSDPPSCCGRSESRGNKEESQGRQISPDVDEMTEVIGGHNDNTRMPREDTVVHPSTTVAPTRNPGSEQGVSPSQQSASASAPDDIESKESSAFPVTLPPSSAPQSRLDSSATNERAIVQQFSVLFRLPVELLERLALEVALLEPLGPPKDLIAFLCTCKRVHDFLAFDRCHNLFARIFKAKFDISAVRRRFGPKSVRSTSLALQLKKYCTTLQDIRGGNIYSSNIHDVLRTAFFMAMENDGRNSYQLAWAGLDRFVDRFVRTRLGEDVAMNSGWPAENSVNAFALWLMWFTTTRDKLAAESVEQRQQIIDIISPYVMLPFHYPSAYAPPNHFDLPLPRKFGKHFPHLVKTPHGPYPLYHSPRLKEVDHFGRSLEFSRPLITIAAKMLYFARRDMVPIGMPRHLPIDRAHAVALGHTHVRPTQADVHEVNRYPSCRTVERAPWDYLAGMTEEEKRLMDSGLWTPTLASASAKWENDWNRVTFCYDPWQRMPLKGVTYTHGMLNGLWQGRMLVPTETYMTLTVAPHRPYNFGQSNSLVTTVPLFMRLREHHCINPQYQIITGGKHNGFDDGLENAWLPPLRMHESGGKVTTEDEHGKIYIYDTYVPEQPNAHDEKICMTCIDERGDAERDMRRGSASLSDSNSDLDLGAGAVPADVEDVFERCGLGRGQNADEEDDDMHESRSECSEQDEDEESDTEEVKHQSCSGIRDILLTGSTDFSHGQAWNNYIFYGRIRRWDGLIALVRVPRHSNGHEQRYLSRWVFTGYVVGGQNFVGTWRGLRGLDVGMPTWESAFSVSRRD